MKSTSRITNTFKAAPMLIAAGLAGGYTAPAQAIAIYQANINATMTIDLVDGLEFTGFGDPIIPIQNDPDGAGPSTANAGGTLDFSNNGFTASASANGSAVPTPATSASDSLASVSGTIVNTSGAFVATTATITGDWFVGASVADPIESATAGVLLDLSFLPGPLIDQTVSAPNLATGDLLVELGEDPFLFNITLDPLTSFIFTFEVRAFGSATGVVDGQPAPINVVPVPEPGTLVLLAAGLLVLVSVSRRRAGRQLALSAYSATS